MKAYELARILYPALRKQDFIELSCPDNLLLCEKIEDCDKHKLYVDNDCTKCWEREVSQKRADWLIEASKMQEMMGFDY